MYLHLSIHHQLKILPKQYFTVILTYLIFKINWVKQLTLLLSSDKTFSKTPNGIATDVGTLIHEGNLLFRFAMLRDFAPTCEVRKFIIICLLENNTHKIMSFQTSHVQSQYQTHLQKLHTCPWMFFYLNWYQGRIHQ